MPALGELKKSADTNAVSKIFPLFSGKFLPHSFYIVEAISRSLLHNMNQLNFFDPKVPVGMLGGNLPHWRQYGVTYYVTFRLGDSMPQQKLWQWQREREEWMKRHPLPHNDAEKATYHARFVSRFERWLDAGHGSCVLRHPLCRNIVEQALRWGSETRYRLGRFVVMPNHVHVVVSPYGAWTLSGILASWKKYTARRINEHLCVKGRFWQKESFDHIVRNDKELMRINTYIERNPEKAGIKIQ